MEPALARGLPAEDAQHLHVQREANDRRGDQVDAREPAEGRQLQVQVPVPEGHGAQDQPVPHQKHLLLALPAAQHRARLLADAQGGQEGDAHRLAHSALHARRGRRIKLRKLFSAVISTLR